MPTARARGHRTRPHTADVILEAWGPDLAACCEEAVAGLVEVFAEADGTPEVGRRRVVVPPAPAERLLVQLLEEVIFLLDTAEGIPVAASVERAGSDGLEATVVLAEPSRVPGTGVVPKAVARSELSVEERPGAVWCRFLVDV